jgi:hypothetical protein
MSSKICGNCKLDKEFKHFNKNKRTTDGYSRLCKECTAEYNKKYREENRETLKSRCANYYENNKEIYSNWNNENKEQINLKKRLNYSKRIKEDELYRLKMNLKALIRMSLKRNKTSNTNDIIGCSYNDFKTYIESKFESWMNWNNYGNSKNNKLEPNKTWDLDHIIPISSGNTKEDLIKLSHYSNFQPLCSYQNRVIKKNHIH